MTNKMILFKLKRALKNFYKKESLLVEYKVAERALTHKLAEYLQKLFHDYNVDCEYNKVGDGDSKRVSALMDANSDCPHNCNECPANKCVIFPDIIVHKRGTDENILVIEAKTSWSRQSSENDHKKLIACRLCIGNPLISCRRIFLHVQLSLPGFPRTPPVQTIAGAILECLSKR